MRKSRRGWKRVDQMSATAIMPIALMRMIFFCTTHVCGDARAYIQQLEHNIGELTEKVAQLEAAQPMWISVIDGMPAPETRVLASAIDNDGESIVVITKYTHRLYGLGLRGWLEPWQYFSCNYKITHWMPLPKPPKEGE